MIHARPAIAGLMLMLAACGQSDEDKLAALDNSIAANNADPAVTGALEQQIAVDPALTQSSNDLAARPPERPARAEYAEGDRSSGPPTPVNACGGTFDYGAKWAKQLPAAFPLYPGATVTEAAGADRGDCHSRVVTFTTNAGSAAMLDYYETRAVRAGYTAERQQRGLDRIIAGANEATGGAYYVIVTPKGSGSEVAMITNKGA